LTFTSIAVVTSPARELITLLTVLGLVLSIVWINAMCISKAYGQTTFSPSPNMPLSSSSNTSGTKLTTKQPSPSIPPPTSSPSAAASSSTASSSSISHGVRITSPTKGQHVPVGAVLAISGKSKDNATSDCLVNVIANGVKPYQNASATGHGGANDYSSWTFNLTPKYTTIKEGMNNRIVAKFYCNPNPNLASFYSVNVTGVTRR
jgi:cytoskeletal protein RodZ